MTQTELLQRIKERLQALYGARFRGLVLFGSVARGDARKDSDIDLLCLLDGPVSLWREIQNTTRAVYNLALAQVGIKIAPDGAANRAYYTCFPAQK
jgi:uncharacterized protein